MSRTTILLAAVLSLSAAAQTVNSVQNGPWNSPTTWDCNCVPITPASAMITHSVEVVGSTYIAPEQLTVAAGGELTMTFPAEVALATNFMNYGHVLLIGTVTIAGHYFNLGFTEFVGNVASDGIITLYDGTVMTIEGNFVNFFTLDGAGSLCVSDMIENYQEITGLVDICDGTPTATAEPFIDFNAGTVGPSVTFCESGACGTSVRETFGAAMRLSPTITGGMALLTGIPTDARSVRIVDGQGRVLCARSGAITSTFTIDAGAWANGLYQVQVIGEHGGRALPLVVTH